VSFSQMISTVSPALGNRAASSAPVGDGG
jgi:hypothetical protein